jgi:hypothetical protein
MKYIAIIFGLISIPAFAQQQPIPQNNGFTSVPVVFGGKNQSAVFTLWYNTELSNIPKLTFKQTLPDGEIYIRVANQEPVILTGIASVTVPMDQLFIDVFVAGGKKFSHLEISADESKAINKKFEFDVPRAGQIWSTANFMIAKEDCGSFNCTEL